jgi:pyruvate/2-oxoglutarate dehydrogenase complex dihydrolipoamide dehydrogenase (E3) component
MPETPPVQPFDVHNQFLVSNVHPPDWANPEPAPRYNLVVLGAGTAGLVSAAGAAGLGGRVALVEREFMGGDCLNVGCVPSKALIRASRAIAEVQGAHDYGALVPAGTQVNFPAVMERMRRLRAALSPTDSAARFRGLGVDVFFGDARFTGPDAVEVGGRVLRFRRAVIATGARAARPDIPGLADAGFLTNETVFTLTELPPRLAVIGAGPIGCELAQAFARFGSHVTLLGNRPQIMPREDPDAARIVENQMRLGGVNLVLSCNVVRVARDGADKVLHLEYGEKGVGHLLPERPGGCFAQKVPAPFFAGGGQPTEVRADAILVGIGRAPNVQGLDLEAAGVAYDEKEGVKVNDRLQTTNRRIFAAGDICSRFKFTHAADAMARVVIQNALFFGRARASALVIPWCTYTDPEVAHVGLYEAEANARGIDVRTFTEPMARVDRAVLDGDTDGFVKVHVRAGSDRIVGATVVARHAGEMISELTLAMVGGLGLGTLARTIHPYPTQAEAIKRVADAYNRTRLTPFVKWLFQKWLAWMR